MRSEVRRFSASQSKGTESSVCGWQNNLAEFIKPNAISLLTIELMDQALNNLLFWVQVLGLEEVHQLSEVQAARPVNVESIKHFSWLEVRMA